MTNDLIFGYTWEQIQRCQQGGALSELCGRHAIGAKDDICKDGDIEALDEHGAEGLRAKGLFGIIDRLTRSGLME